MPLGSKPPVIPAVALDSDLGEVPGTRDGRLLGRPGPGSGFNWISAGRLQAYTHRFVQTARSDSRMFWGPPPKTSRAPSASRFEWLLVEHTFTNNNNIASNSRACAVSFQNSSTRPHPYQPFSEVFSDFGFADLFTSVFFPWCGVKFEMAFCFGICALSKAILLWCSRALWVSIPNRPHSAVSVFGTCPSRVSAVNGICPAVDGRSPRGRSAQPDGPAPPCTLQ